MDGLKCLAQDERESLLKRFIQATGRAMVESAVKKELVQT
jgi:hypothetical protein